MMSTNRIFSIATLTVIQNVLFHIAGGALIAAFFSLPTSRFLLNVSLFVFLVSFLLSGRYQQKWLSIRSNPVSIPLLGLFACVVIGYFYGPGHPAERSKYLFFYSKLMIGLAVMCHLSGQRKLQHQVLMAFAAGMLLSCIISISKWLGWFPDNYSRLLGANEGDFAAFKDYLIQNVMMAMFCIVALTMVLDGKYKLPYSRAAWTLAFLIGCFAMFIAVERGRTGQIGFLLGVLLIILFAIPRSQRIFWFGCCFVFIFALYATYDPWQKNIIRAFSELYNYQAQNETSVGNRMYLHHWALEQAFNRNWIEHLMGTGTASYQALAQRAFSATVCVTSCPHPHSQFLFWWFDHGILGLGLFMLLFARLIQLAKQLVLRSHKILTLGFISIFFINSLFHSSLWLRMEGYFSILMIALLASLNALPQKATLASSDSALKN